MKRKLYWELMIGYILFLVISVILLVGFMALVSIKSFSTLTQNPEYAQSIYAPISNIEYDNNKKVLNYTGVIDDNSWVEILKENKVVYVKGNKQDDKNSYTQEELANYLYNIYNINQDNNITVRYIPFTGKDNENYVCLIKKISKPESFSLKLNLPDNLKGTEVEKNLLTQFKIISFSLLGVILLIIIIFGIITSRRIVIPLEKLNMGLKSVMNGDYSVEVNYKSSYELTKLKDAFNYMTKELEKAEKENRKLTESKKQLLLDISHDLKTPSTTIQGYAEALSSGIVADEEEKKKYLEYIYDKSKYITSCIDTLFRYSQLDTSIYKLNKKVINFPEFLRTVIIGYYGELETKGFLLDIDITDNDIFYNFDELEFNRAISNIINNIIKYNPQGTTLYVKLQDFDSYLQLIIGDNGVGIPNHIQKDIFNPLVRGDSSRKNDGGIGLGLAITKKIIKLHDCEIKLESKEGQGTKFIITINNINKN